MHALSAGERQRVEIIRCLLQNLIAVRTDTPRMTPRFGGGDNLNLHHNLVHAVRGLLPVGYFHLVFTLPGPIASIAYQNKAVIYDLLFKAAAEATLTIAADPKRLGARIGITSVLHSWGSALTHHPHVHLIVPGGGISLDGTRWVPCRPGFFLPVRVLSRLFRRLFLERIVAAHQQLLFFGSHAPLVNAKAFATYLAPLRKTEWVVYVKRPFGGPEAVLAYLAQVDEARNIRVHPTFPDPRAAMRLPPHPPLWTVRQWQSRRRGTARGPDSAGPSAVCGDGFYRGERCHPGVRTVVSRLPTWRN